MKERRLELLNKNCPDGGMVDTADSKSVAERRPGSSPGWGTTTAC
jgi:hypothetical protein